MDWLSVETVTGVFQTITGSMRAVQASRSLWLGFMGDYKYNCKINFWGEWIKVYLCLCEANNAWKML